MIPVILSPFACRLLATIVFLLVPLSIIAPHAVVWEILIGGGVGLYYSRHQNLKALPQPLVLTLLSISLWGIVTALWSQYPLTSLITGLKIAGLVILGIYWCRLVLSLPQETKKKLANALVGGVFLGILFLAIDAWFGNPWQAFWKRSPAKALAQGSLIVSLATWPTLLWVCQQPYSLKLRFGLVTALLFLVFWVLFQIDCDTSFIGLFLGIWVFAGTLLLPRVASWGMRLFVPLLVASFPFISLYAFKPEYIPAYNAYIYSQSYLDRLYIWNEVATSIFEHPWRGIGMDGTRGHEKTRMMHEWSYIDKKGVEQKHRTGRFAIHPHNAILQLWLELGLPGVILGIILTCQVLFYIYCSNLRIVEKAIAAGFFTGAFLIVWVNLGFWQNWWVSGLWIVIGLIAMMCKSAKNIREIL